MKHDKNAILMIMLITVIILLILTIAMLVYLFHGNITSKIPEKIKKECNVKEQNYQGRSVFVMSTKQKDKSKKVIFYLHGGSYIAELSNAHWEFLSKLAQDTKATIIVPDYPLAPQYHYTDVFNMIYPLYQEITNKVESHNLIVMGDSAGGGMALALMEKVGEESSKEKSKKVPSKTILISPWLDVTMTNPKIKQVQEKDKMLNQELLKLAGISYAGAEEETKNYLVSPLYGPIQYVNNLVIYTGTNDILNPDVQILQEKAKQNNKPIVVKETKEAAHDWLIMRYQDEKYEDGLAKEAYESLLQELS